MILVFTNLYIKYKNYSREFFLIIKKSKKKEKEKKDTKKMRQLEELTENTNKYMRENVLAKKLQDYDIDQLKKYLEFLKKQFSNIKCNF